MADMLKMNDGESDYTLVRPICCSVKAFTCTNITWGVVSFLMLAVGLVGFLVEGGVLILLPPQAYIVIAAFGGVSVLTVACGLFGKWQKIECCFLIYIFLMALSLIAQTLGYSFLMLYVNDVSSIIDIRESALDAEDSVLQGLLIDLAEDKADVWVDTQNNFECCGIDFEISFDPDILEGIETGDACNDPEAQTNLTALRDPEINDINDPALSDEFGNFIPARDDPVVGIKAEFFCMSKISSVMKDFLPYIAVVVGLILLSQVSALVAATRLYWVPDFVGGWQFPDDELEAVAERKGLPFVAKTQQGPAKGNRVLSTIRQQTNRLSFRLRNAYTADPSVPASSGFMNRFSMNRNRVSGHGSFRGIGVSQPRPGAYNPQSMAVQSNEGASSVAGGNSVAGSATGSRAYIDIASPPGLPPSTRSLTPSQINGDEDW